MSRACARIRPQVAFWLVGARGLLIALMMESARTSETLVNFYQTTRCYNPEDSHLRTHHRENLIPYFLFLFFDVLFLRTLLLES
jgi:hypothetical protein